MDFSALIEHYGYAAVFAGSVLEGETVVVLGGFAAHRGYLSLGGVIAVAAAGAYIGDQACFVIGRFFGRRLVARWPRLEPSIARADALLERRGALLVIGLRFVYGLRLAGALAIGMSRMSWLRYSSLNVLGVLLWAPIVAGAGYLLGNAVEPLLENVRAAEYWVFGGIIVIGTAVWSLRRQRRKNAAAIARTTADRL